MLKSASLLRVILYLLHIDVVKVCVKCKKPHVARHTFRVPLKGLKVGVMAEQPNNRRKLCL